MGLSNISSGERTHIGFFGLRNAGKSSLVNAIAAQNISIVSDTLGTTTDPVKKSMELLPVGPVVLVDTPGLDDIGELGTLRVNKAYEQLELIDIAVVVLEYKRRLCSKEIELIKKLKDKKKPYIAVFNKADLYEGYQNEKPDFELYNSEFSEARFDELNSVIVSTADAFNIEKLKLMLASFEEGLQKKRYIVADLIPEASIVVLVIPIDEAAPKGRIILPQQLVLRELLEHSCTVSCCKPEQLKESIERLKAKPDLVITDSQVFEYVAGVLERDVKLTSFSILFARYKGELSEFIKGLRALDSLKDGDKVLISEACTHHRQCNDIGTVKMPGWLSTYSGVKLEYVFSSGNDFSADLRDISLVVHCGACMITEQAMKARLETIKDFDVPIINYGMAIAKMKGIFPRATEIFD